MRNIMDTRGRRGICGILKNARRGRAGGGADLEADLVNWQVRGMSGGARLLCRARVDAAARGNGGRDGLGLGRRGFRLRLGLSLGRREFDPAAEFTRKKTQCGSQGCGEAETVAGDGAGEDGAGERFERGIIHHRHALEDFQDDDADDCVQPAERAGLACDQIVVGARFWAARFGCAWIGHALIIGVLGKLSRTKANLENVFCGRL
jgi:hypothetical protein